jgi:hypothetical protein
LSPKSADRTIFIPKIFTVFVARFSSLVRKKMLRHSAVIFADERIARFTVIDRWFNSSGHGCHQLFPEFLFAALSE